MSKVIRKAVAGGVVEKILGWVSGDGTLSLTRTREVAVCQPLPPLGLFSLHLQNHTLVLSLVNNSSMF